MGELKSGDIAKHSGKKIILDRSRNVEIIESYEKLTLVCAYGWVQTRKLELVEEDMKYTESNRYKLQQAIKKTGFHAEKLSLASNHAKTYFTGFTAESRFNSRGDITEERLNSLLTTLAFAERELLGVGAKNVDYIETSRPDFFGHGELRVLKPIGDGITDETDSIQREINSNKRLEDLKKDVFFTDAKIAYLDKLNEDRKIGSNKVIVYSDNLKSVLIAFLVVVVLLALWFLFK